jgi:hypothetical protein
VILLRSSPISEAMNKMVDGTIIEKESPPKALVSIRFNREPRSNEIDKSVKQFEKHDDPRISTFRGIRIDRSHDSENAYDSIRFNREFDSNENDENDRQDEKHDDPRISISEQIVIDDDDEKLRINR